MATNSPVKYNYRPLKPNEGSDRLDGEFRLITLVPGRRKSEISCSLYHVSFATPPPYNALSYTWDNHFSTPMDKWEENYKWKDSSQTFTINLDGVSASIGYNFEGALRCLRDRPRARRGQMPFA